MLSAIWKLEMTHRSISLPDFPAVSTPADILSGTDTGGRQIGRARPVPIEVRVSGFSRVSVACWIWLMSAARFIVVIFDDIPNHGKNTSVNIREIGGPIMTSS